jgi:acetate kinase
MGTRSGDLDPAVLLQLARRGGLGIDELDELLNKKSGLLGLSGHGDMRDVVSASAGGDERSALAIAVYTHRITHYIGAYWALLGGLDVITFTAGVGENSADVRAGALAGLAGIGVRIDPERNAAKERGPRVISADDSAVTVLVVPTDEELEIARQTVAVTGR